MTQEIVQGSAEWKMARVGKVTASRVSDIVSKTKAGKPTAAYNEYMSEIVTEILTGQPVEFFMTKDMEWGTKTEPLAREVYEEQAFVEVAQVGIIDHPYLPRAAASPDGLVGDDGLIEIKCPRTKTHVSTLISEEAPEQYIPQMQWQMACTGRVWCDFVSYDPRLPEAYQLFTKRVYRDQTLINKYEHEVRQFLTAVDNLIFKLNTRNS